MMLQYLILMFTVCASLCHCSIQSWLLSVHFCVAAVLFVEQISSGMMIHEPLRHCAVREGVGWGDRQAWCDLQSSAS